MTIDAELLTAVQTLVARGAELRPLHELGAAGARRQVERIVALVPVAPVEIAHVEDRTIPGPLRVRIYRPEDGVLPALVHFHGGGWVIGDLDSHDRTCRRLARDARCVVIAVDYRRAPEHKYPAAHDDAEAAFAWVTAHAAELGVDPARIAAGGDSSGANLATAVCLRARDRGGSMPLFQLLINPVTQYGEKTVSYRANANAPSLSSAEMAWFFEQYLRSPEDGALDEVSPLRARSLAGLPPALVIIAGVDPLRDEGMAFAERLRAEGVAVEARCYTRAIHLFTFLADLAAPGREALELAAAALRRAFAARGDHVS